MIFAILFSMPTPRNYLGVVAASNGKIYAIGGNNGAFLGTVEEYDPAADTWTSRASMPTPRYSLGVAAANNGKICAIGGNYHGVSGIVEEYDPTADTWMSRASMPTARDSLGVATASNGKIYAIGGFDNGSWLGTVEEATLPYESEGNDFYNTQWLSPTRYRVSYDINSLIPRGTYSITVDNAIGTDGIAIAPNSAYTFTVDYAGGVVDTTPPPAPSLNIDICRNSTTSVAASWFASDPNSAITLYQYALGSSANGVDVINWTDTGSTSVTRTGLNLVAGQRYSFSVKARNAGGLWSPPTSNSFTAGIPCQKLYLPLVLKNY